MVIKNIVHVYCLILHQMMADDFRALSALRLNQHMFIITILTFPIFILHVSELLKRYVYTTKYLNFQLLCPVRILFFTIHKLYKSTIFTLFCPCIERQYSSKYRVNKFYSVFALIERYSNRDLLYATHTCTLSIWRGVLDTTLCDKVCQ